MTSPTEWFASIQAVEAGFDDGGFAGAAQAAYGEYVAPGVELAGCLLDGTSTERAYCAGGALTVLAVSAAVPSTAGLISRALRPRNATGSILRTGTSATRSTGPGTDLVRVGDVADDASAFSHYAKHAKGIEMRPNGGFRLNAGGPDMPEFSSFGEYRSAGRQFMGGGAPEGTLEGIRPGGDLVRLDPKTGYFGARSPDGTIRTFFRPDGGPGEWLDYFYGQFK